METNKKIIYIVMTEAYSDYTIVAAIKEQRLYIGIEKDEHYFEVAKKRIKNETSQLSLF